MTFWVNILSAGVSNGTALLFATIGELLAERAGVLNLGVEGMMLMGAVAAYGTAAATGDPWLGLLVGMLAGGILSLLHAFVVISLRADQVVSGLSLTFLGTGLSLVLGEGLASVKGVPTIPTFSLPLLADLPFFGPIFFDTKSVLVYVGYVLIPLMWFYVYRTRSGLHLRAIGEYPAAADSLGINVYALRYFYVFIGGVLAGLAGGAITLSITPGWFSEFTTSGYGWIAIGLVIFAHWIPLRENDQPDGNPAIARSREFAEPARRNRKRNRAARQSRQNAADKDIKITQRVHIDAKRVRRGGIFANRAQMQPTARAIHIKPHQRNQHIPHIHQHALGVEKNRTEKRKVCQQRQTKGWNRRHAFYTCQTFAQHERKPRAQKRE